MSRSSRRTQAEVRLAQLEAEFVGRLMPALRDCATGRWGLFGRNDDLLHVGSRAQELVALGDEICGLRAELGLADPFTLYA